jgi:peptide/nickel transport system permease protein
VQYVRFYGQFFTGELRSFKDNQPVLGKIVERTLTSLPLFVVGTVLVWCYAFPFGIATVRVLGDWAAR